MPELPDEKKHRFIKDFKLSEYDTSILIADKHLSEFYESILIATIDS